MIIHGNILDGETKSKIKDSNFKMHLLDMKVDSHKENHGLEDLLFLWILKEYSSKMPIYFLSRIRLQLKKYRLNFPSLNQFQLPNNLFLKWISKFNLKILKWTQHQNNFSVPEIKIGLHLMHLKKCHWNMPWIIIRKRMSVDWKLLKIKFKKNWKNQAKKLPMNGMKN